MEKLRDQHIEVKRTAMNIHCPIRTFINISSGANAGQSVLRS